MLSCVVDAGKTSDDGAPGGFTGGTTGTGAGYGTGATGAGIGGTGTGASLGTGGYGTGAFGTGGYGTGGYGTGGYGTGSVASGGLGSGGVGTGASGSGGVTGGTGGGAPSGGGPSGGGTGGVQPPPPPPPPPLDVTFYAVADTHADPPKESHDLRAMARIINKVSQGGQWPSSIAGKQTNFVGGSIAPPRGVIFLGDITGWGTAPTEIDSFRYYFQQGYAADSINYPGFIGLGNHDVDPADRDPGTAAAYRAQYWAFVDERHKGAGAPVPVTNFDAASHSYSWDFDGVHMVQLHRHAGDDNFGLASNLPFLISDLDTHANDGRPVFTFHHYGMDAFGTQDRWWTAAERNAYRDALAGHNVVGIFVGHSHAAFNYDWEGRHVFQVNNAKAENGTGNNDGNGSFSIVRVTEGRLDVVTCRWLDDQGNYELVEPFYSASW